MKYQPLFNHSHSASHSLEQTGVMAARDPQEIELNRQELWTPSDLAPMLGITDRAVRYHCQHLFGHRTRYRLTHQEAWRLCKFIRKFGLKSKKFSEFFPNS